MANIDRSSSEHGELPRRWSSGSLNQSENRMAKRVALLERDSARIVDRARGAGVSITYLGVASLFREPQAYAGAETNWVIAPVFDHSEAVVPRAERRDLQRLVDAGIDFPLVYMAHEIPKDRLTLAPAAYGQPSAAVNLDRAAAAHVVGTPPPPVAAAELANRLGRSSHQILDAMAKALPVAKSMMVAPFTLVGAVLGGLAAGLDPIVFGVIPADRGTPGQPASWFILAQWEWPAGAGPDPTRPSASQE